MHKTKMDPNKVIDSDVYNFRSEEIALSEATRITNKKTGATVKLTPNVKAAYKVMRYRYSYFSTEHQGYFDNQDDIAAGCSLGLSTIERILPVLASAGLIEIESITLAKDKRSNSYVVHNINPDDFLLERKDKKLGWVNCLEYPVFGSKRPQEAPKVEVQETEAVKETSPQEPQQPERKPALTSSDDIHTSAESGSDDSQDEQQTESPPDDYCADDWLTDFQSEPNERSEDEELHNIYEEYKLYCDLEGIDYKAYQESFIQFMDKTMIDSRFEEFKNLGQYLFSKDWDEEYDREIEGGYH